jgi:hypothetical protein
MIAMAIWVKLPAVPGPPPGPWEATAAPVQSEVASVDAAARAKADIGSPDRFDAKIISCDEKLSEDTDESLIRFCRMSRE